MIGHEAIERMLKRLADTNALGHAYLFFGDTNIGKASVAHSFAHYIEKKRFVIPDVPLVDTLTITPNEKGSIGVDEARAIKRFLWQTPLSSPKRIVIIDGADAMTPEAQGAMLKIVEEPPTHGLLLFITRDPETLFSPLVSRLSKIYFSRLSMERVREYLVKEQNLSASRAEQIARESFGRIGRVKILLASKNEEEESVERDIEMRILALWKAGVMKYSTPLASLLAREEAVARFNVNPNIQKKAIEYIANRSYN